MVVSFDTTLGGQTLLLGGATLLLGTLFGGKMLSLILLIVLVTVLLALLLYPRHHRKYEYILNPL